MTTYVEKMNKTEVEFAGRFGSEVRAVSAETAFAGVKSGDWDWETFEMWVSKVKSDAYDHGDGDRTYASAM